MLGIRNLSSHKLDPSEIRLLSRGLNFNVGYRPSLERMTCAVEQAVRLVDPPLRDAARSRAIGVLSKLSSSKTDMLLVAEKTSLRRLQQNKDIVILPADKGYATVILDRSDYVSKMTSLLEDEATYAKVSRDPTKKIESELQKLLTEMFKLVPPESKYLYYKLLCHNGSAPAVYGLPKVHKPEVPLRPIVDFTRSPLYELSGYLHRVLRPLVGNTPTYVRDSAHFIEILGGVTVDDDEVMVSFDVKSMFTCVTVDYTVRCCKVLLDNDASLPSRTPFEMEDLCRQLEFCMKNMYFIYNGHFYKQQFGTAMGASVSVACANIAF
ncbi:uncharacterized protein LOC119395131 [Rhipicephalus sanguineus]|uniref:uncharacterized protein LOC119395131 n=1 Tax=Rhipicephalus sanguineus TaxID=34632 RepID=UPI00189488CE|nr:uncharacterized protein LOC119395131 [Rhipicephalus sanguineus]